MQRRGPYRLWRHTHRFIEQPGGSRQDGPVLPDPAAAPEGMAAEDVAARIAGARNQAQTDMLELARSQQNESERE